MQNIFSKKQEQEDLSDQIEQLKKMLAHLQAHEKKQEVHYHFQIEQIQVDYLNLEQLLFQLEKMHTEYLNGTLNFGNNFSGSLHKTSEETLLKQEKAQKVQPHHVHINLRSREAKNKNEST